MNHSLALTESPLSFPLFNSGASGVKYFVLLMAWLMACGAIFFLHICPYLSVFRILIFVGVRACSGIKRLNMC